MNFYVPIYMYIIFNSILYEMYYGRVLNKSLRLQKLKLKYNISRNVYSLLFLFKKKNFFRENNLLSTRMLSCVDNLILKLGNNSFFFFKFANDYVMDSFVQFATKQNFQNLTNQFSFMALQRALFNITTMCTCQTKYFNWVVFITVSFEKKKKEKAFIHKTYCFESHSNYLPRADRYVFVKSIVIIVIFFFYRIIRFLYVRVYLAQKKSWISFNAYERLVVIFIIVTRGNIFSAAATTHTPLRRLR